MKTVSDRNKDQAAARAEAKQAASEAQKHRIAYLAEIEAQNLNPKEPELSLHRDDIRTQLRKDFTGFVDTACDHCKTALVDQHPGSVLACNPPKFRADCPGCGASYALALANRIPWIPPHT